MVRWPRDSLFCHSRSQPSLVCFQHPSNAPNPSALPTTCASLHPAVNLTRSAMLHICLTMLNRTKRPEATSSLLLNQLKAKGQMIRCGRNIMTTRMPTVFCHLHAPPLIVGFLSRMNGACDMQIKLHALLRKLHAPSPSVRLVSLGEVVSTVPQNSYPHGHTQHIYLCPPWQQQPQSCACDRQSCAQHAPGQAGPTPNPIT